LDDVEAAIIAVPNTAVSRVPPNAALTLGWALLAMAFGSGALRLVQPSALAGGLRRRE
jgi:hypothetical protein